MSQVVVRCHAELNDFLARARQGTTIVYHVAERTSVKDVIESLNVPHTEVAFLFVNTRPVDFTYLIHNGDEIDAFPASQRSHLPFDTFVELRPPPSPRFVVDTHLGRLAGYLRMLGFDTLYSNSYHDDELASISASADRILLTRDIGLLKRAVVLHGYFVRSTDPEKQIIEVLQRFSFFDCLQIFQRCIRCNGLLHTVPKEQIADQLQPLTRTFYHEFQQCEQCEHIYWKGSHYQTMQQLITRIRQT